jgi:hypothetical protein
MRYNRRNHYAVFDPAVNGLDLQTSRVAETIVEALREGYFRLHYQPLEWADGELNSFEALIRMEHPQLGLSLLATSFRWRNKAI